MCKIIAVIYGVAAYAVFFVTFLYSIGFVGDVFVSKTIDSGPEGSFTVALLINAGLLALFGVQHSLMARAGFKKLWTKLVPEPVERSTYVLISSLLLVLLFWQWRAMTGTVWEVAHPFARTVLWVLFWAGWGLVLVSTFLIDHFDLFGLRQVYLYARGREYVEPEFKVASLYKVVRHPLFLGFVIGAWATPRMTVGHLVFTIAITGYILVGIQFEERDLVRSYGKLYEDYRRRVPMLLPIPRWRRGPDASGDEV